MRPELERMDLADRYLRGELSGDPRSAFEQRMRSDPELNETVADHRSHEGIPTQTSVEPLMPADEPGEDAAAATDSVPRPSPRSMTRPVSRTDTVIMMMRNGELVPVSAQDTVGRGVRKVITIPVTGTSRQELLQRMDSVQRATERTGSGQTVQPDTIPKDSLEKLLNGRRVPSLH